MNNRELWAIAPKGARAGDIIHVPRPIGKISIIEELGIASFGLEYPYDSFTLLLKEEVKPLIIIIGEE